MTGKMMKAAVVTGIGNIQVVDKSIPSCPQDSMLVKVEACAICGSDLRIYKKGLGRWNGLSKTPH